MGLISVGPYTSALLQRGISWLKFKGITATAKPLAELLLPRLLVIAPLEQLQEQAVLVPIPLHKRRQRERGFNQSAEIAFHLSNLTGIATASLLDRPKATWTQSHLPKELRQQNVTGIFTYVETADPTKPLAIIIDDVTTSGSTLTAAALVLKQANFPLIWGATIARG
jgi:ComF family protein